MTSFYNPYAQMLTTQHANLRTVFDRAAIFLKHGLDTVSREQRYSLDSLVDAFDAYHLPTAHCN
jgi:hypothetical protein